MARSLSSLSLRCRTARARSSTGSFFMRACNARRSFNSCRKSASRAAWNCSISWDRSGRQPWTRRRCWPGPSGLRPRRAATRNPRTNAGCWAGRFRRPFDLDRAELLEPTPGLDAAIRRVGRQLQGQQQPRIELRAWCARTRTARQCGATQAQVICNIFCAAGQLACKADQTWRHRPLEKACGTRRCAATSRPMNAPRGRHLAAGLLLAHGVPLR